MNDSHGNIFTCSHCGDAHYITCLRCEPCPDCAANEREAVALLITALLPELQIGESITEFNHRRDDATAQLHKIAWEAREELRRDAEDAEREKGGGDD